MVQKRLLCIDDNEQQSRLFEIYGEMYDEIEVDCCLSLSDASYLIGKNQYDLVFLDNRLHPHRHFRETLPSINEDGYKGKVIIMSSDISEALGYESKVGNTLIFVDKSDIGIHGFRKLMNEHVLN